MKLKYVVVTSVDRDDLRDGGAAFGGYDVRRAVQNVNGEIAARLTGMEAGDQRAIDGALIDLDGTPNKENAINPEVFG